MSGRDRPGGTWSNLDPSTEWLEDEMEPATTPHVRPAPPEPDGTPTVLSGPTGLPVGLRDHPRVNRQSPSVDSEPLITHKGAPVHDDPRVIDYLRSIDANMQREADAAVESVEMLRTAGEWARFVFFGVMALFGISGFLAMATFSAFLLFRGAS